jgi:hypothetical protein
MKGEQKEATMQVTKTILGKTKTKSEKMKVRLFATDTMQVGLKMGACISMGGYDNIKVEVFASVPCYVEEANSVFKQVEGWVGKKLDEEVIKIKEEFKEYIEDGK